MEHDEAIVVVMRRHSRCIAFSLVRLGRLFFSFLKIRPLFLSSNVLFPNDLVLLYMVTHTHTHSRSTYIETMSGHISEQQDEAVWTVLNE